MTYEIQHTTGPSDMNIRVTTLEAASEQAAYREFSKRLPDRLIVRLYPVEPKSV